MSDLICAHCQRRMRGSAALHDGPDRYDLCHPDVGMDCYHLVTIYRHPLTGCPPCIEKNGET